MSHGIFLLQMANRLKLLHKLYTDENSPVFLTKNIDYLLKFTKKHPQLRELTKSEILAYTNSLSDISRDREKRILRGRKRYLSHRRWIVHAPCNISKFFSHVHATLYDGPLVGQVVRRSVSPSVTSIFDREFRCFEACNDSLLPLCLSHNDQTLFTFVIQWRLMCYS